MSAEGGVPLFGGGEVECSFWPDEIVEPDFGREGI